MLMKIHVTFESGCGQWSMAVPVFGRWSMAVPVSVGGPWQSPFRLVAHGSACFDRWSMAEPISIGGPWQSLFRSVVHGRARFGRWSILRLSDEYLLFENSSGCITFVNLLPTFTSHVITKGEVGIHLISKHC